MASPHHCTAEVHSVSQEFTPQALLWIHGLGLLQGNPPPPVELELSAGIAGPSVLHHGMAVPMQSACCLTKVKEQLYHLSPGDGDSSSPTLPLHFMAIPEHFASPSC